MKRKLNLDLSESKKISKDKNYFLNKIKKNVNNYDKISDDFKYDKDIILEVMNNNHKKYKDIYKDLPENLKCDKDIIFLLMKYYRYYLFEYAPLSIKNNYDFVLKIVKIHGDSLKHASEELKNNKIIVLEAIKNYAHSLEYASEELKNNYDIVFEAVKKRGLTLQYASDEFKNNYNIVLEAVKQYSKAFEYASPELKNNYNLVLEVVKNANEYDISPLYYASNELKNNYNIVLEAVKNNSEALQFASKELKNNSNIILEASKDKRYNDFKFYKIYVSKELRNNYDFILQLVTNNHKMFKHILKKFKDNFNIALVVTQQRFYYFDNLSDKLKHDKNFILELSNESNIYNKLSFQFKNDEEIILSFLLNYTKSSIINDIPQELYNNRDFILKVLELKHFPIDIITKISTFYNDKEIMLKFLKINSLCLQYIPGKLQDDKDIFDIILNHININPSICIFISENIKYNKLIIFKLLEKNYLVIEFFSNDILNNKYYICVFINYLILHYKDQLLNMYNKILDKLSDDNKLFSQEIIDICYYNKYNIDILKKNYKYIYIFTIAKQFNIVKYIYDTDNYNLLLLDHIVLNYISKNIILFPNLINYLLENKLYKIIYNYEELNEYIKDNNYIIVKSISDIDIENEYDKEQLKVNIEKQFQKYKIIWID